MSIIVQQKIFKAQMYRNIRRNIRRNYKPIKFYQELENFKNIKN